MVKSQDKSNLKKIKAKTSSDVKKSKAHKKGGRNLLPPEKIRSYRVTGLRFNREEMLALELLKDKTGFSIAEIFRSLLLKQPIKVPVLKLFPLDVLEVLRDLRRATGLLQVIAWKEMEITVEEKSYLFDTEIGLVRTIEQAELYVTQGLRKADSIEKIETLASSGESLIVGLSNVAIQDGKLNKKQFAELNELKRIILEIVAETQRIGNYTIISTEV